MSDPKNRNMSWYRRRWGGSSIPAKGLFLISVPVGIQLLFLFIFLLIRNNVMEDRRMSLHSRNVLLLSLTAENDFTISFNRALVFVVSRAEQYNSDYAERIRIAEQDLTDLKQEVKDSPTQLLRVENIQAKFDVFKSTLRDITTLVSEMPGLGSEERDEKVSNLSALLDRAAAESRDIRKEFDVFIEIEKGLDLKRQTRLQASLNSLYWLFILGALTIVLGAGSLHKFFSETFSKRVQAIIRNVKAVSLGTPLNDRVAGEDELAEIGQAIHHLSESLREKDAETELFIYSVSHDLRSPLVNIHGFNEELRISLDEIQKLLSEPHTQPERDSAIRTMIDRDLRESLRFIRAATERMANIIDSLLRLSRAGRTEYRSERVDLRELVRKVTDALSGSIAEKKAEVLIEPLPAVLGDPSALEQVFQNLVVNSLKYSSPERPPKIEIGVENFDGGMVTIFVRDNGLGISPEAQGKLFVAFRRFHPDAGPGEGIGLAISRQVILRHRGRIWCESSTGSGSGTVFYVSLPLSSDEERRDAVPAAEAVVGEQRKT